MTRVTFNNKNNAFFTSLKADVEKYFISHHIKKTGNWLLYSKALVLAFSAIAVYVILLTVSMPALAAIILCLLLGFILASIGFNLMHDACHGSFSEKKWVNELVGYSLNAMGGIAFFWKFKHNILHHSYTNVDGLDDDIAKSPLMRQCASQKWVPAHRFQHIYVILVYAIASLAWIFLMDFDKYFKKEIYKTPLQRMNWKERLIFWVTKIYYIIVFIVIPGLIVGWGPWAVGYICMNVTMGLTLALVFQLAHVVEITGHEAAAGMEHKVIGYEWAIHQVRVTANFAPGNKLVTWFVGGLNYQVEHHLFPRISHVHYPAISNIVEKNCKEFNLPYNSYPTMRQSMVSHFRKMKQLGRKPSYA